jgi:membrane protease YdiL (CAAX protease family)
MDALARTGVAGLPTHAPPLRPERPVRLFGLALVWLLAASATAWAWVSLIGVVVGLHNGAPLGRALAWQIGQPPAILLMLLVADVVLVFAGWGRGAVVGGGDARAGLGFGPIRRIGLLLAFATMGEAVVLGWAILVYGVLQPADHGVIASLLAATPSASMAEQAGILFCTVVLSPVWEEFFFRGWLWTGLRRHWGTLPVMFATAVPWLSLHMFDGLLRPLYLLPMAVMLCLARQYCGGIRASITLHVLNNLIAMLLVLFLMPPPHP